MYFYCCPLLNMEQRKKNVGKKEFKERWNSKTCKLGMKDEKIKERKE